MLFFGDQLAVILATIFGRGTLGVLAKETAEVIAVCKPAACGDIFDFKIVAFQQLARVFESRLGQVFVEPHVANLLKEVGKVVRRDVERLRDGFTG